MTAWQELSAKLSSARPSSVRSGASEDPWEHAPAPAKVAKRIAEGVFKRSISPDLIPLLSNVMHWGTGIGWGGIYGLAANGRSSRPRDGALFGTLVWIMSYVQLVPMGIYEPPWDYPAKVLALDLSYHLVYGTGVAAGYDILSRARV